MTMSTIKKEELEKLYYSKTNKEVCEILGVSKVTLNTYLKKAGIVLKGKGNHRKYEIEM